VRTFLQIWKSNSKCVSRDCFAPLREGEGEVCK
jgi:hypothetical protein